MFTPQRHRKVCAGWALSPRAGGGAALAVEPSSGRTGGGVVTGKGKTVAEAPPPPPPPRRLLGEGEGGDAGEDAEVWKSFRDAGFLDEDALQRKEKEAMARRIAKLEKELHDYQYNMGLILIEKNEWASKFEEIRRALEESEEILKREQSAHFITVSELEKREENMRKALGVEKQCVVDLEKALRGMQDEVSEIKFTADKKLSEAHALEAGLEEKYLDIQAKLHSADAKLAVACRKSSEVDRKLQDVEDRERILERDRLSLNAELKAHENDLSQQRGHLLEWEKNLQEGQKRLLEGQSSLNEREQRVNGLERDLKNKDRELEEVQKQIDSTCNSLKEKEVDVNARLRAQSAREKEVDVIQKNLEKKERELCELEENLNARERVEMQKLLDGHSRTLTLKKEAFARELEDKRRSFDEELKNKLDAVEKDRNVIKHKEEQILRREKALDDKMEKLKEKEKDIDAKLKASKDKGKSLKDEENKLDEERKQIAKDYQKLVDSKAELESLKTAVEAKQQQIKTQEDNLKITEEERKQHTVMQSLLKKEIEDYILMKESLARQIDDLRQEREKFEAKWEALCEERKGLEIERKQVNDERGKFEICRQREEERLKNEKKMARIDIERELEDLRLKKEASENLMTHERSQALQLLEKERADLIRTFELRMHELEVNMQKKQEEMEKKLQEKEDEFNKRRELEISSIRCSSNLNELKARELKTKIEHIEKEKEEISARRERLEAEQIEIQKDIDTLCILSRNLKDQRQELIKEREHFLAMVDQCKICKTCGVAISELELLGLEPAREIEDAGNVLLPSFADGFLEEHTKGRGSEQFPQVTGSQSVASDGRMSWLRKCTRLFKFSPGKGAEHFPEGHAKKSNLSGQRLDIEALQDGPEYEPEPSFGITNDSCDTQQARSNQELEDNEKSGRFDEVRDDPEPSFGVADDSIDFLRIPLDNGFREIEGEPRVPSILERNEMEVSSLPPGSYLQSQASNKRRHQPGKTGRPKVIKRTRSMKAVVEDAKAILGETLEDNKDGQPIGNPKDLNIHEDSLGDSGHAGQMAARTRQRKRPAHASGVSASELDADNSETRSDSVSLGGRRKRRQINAFGAPLGEKRYNLRRSTIVGSAAAAQATSDQSKEHRSESHQPSENVVLKSGCDGGTSKHAATEEPLSRFACETEKPAHLLQKTTIKSIVEIHDVSFQKPILLESFDNVVMKSVEFNEQGTEDGEEVDRVERETTPAATHAGEYSGSEDEDDYEDDEDENKQNASIGKKLWTFFTT